MVAYSLSPSMESYPVSVVRANLPLSASEIEIKDTEIIVEEFTCTE